MQQPFQVVGVPHMPRRLGVARLEQRLHLVKQDGLDQRLVRPGMQRTLVADDARIVGVW